MVLHTTRTGSYTGSIVDGIGVELGGGSLGERDWASCRREKRGER